MIDDHAHPFPLSTAPFAASGPSLDVDDDPGADARRAELGPSRLATEALRVRLAAHLGCAPDDVGAARDAAAADWPAYVGGLFADSGCTGLLLDPAAAALPTGGVAPYAVTAGVPVWELARVEPVLDALVAAGASAAEVVAGVEEHLVAAVARGAVGAKTVIAYRTGLDVDAGADLAAAQRSLEQDRCDGVPVRRAAKALRDHVLVRVLGVCAALDVPLQVHTGFGDSSLRLAGAEPILLDGVLGSPVGRAARVVLIHGGFGWPEQVAHLAGVRPGVWAELSLSNLVSPVGTAARLLALVDLAPTSRITLGSDGHGGPETHWFAQVVLRDAWAAVRAQVGPLVTRRWLDDVEHSLMTGNAQQLYRL